MRYVGKKMRGAIADDRSMLRRLSCRFPHSASTAGKPFPPTDDIQACFDALVADVDRRADDQLAQVMLAVTAEGAAEQLRRGRFHYADGDKRGQIVSSLRRLELGGQDIPIVVAKRLRD